MQRDLRLQVCQTSWPNSKPPQSLRTLAGTRTIEVTSFLLMIGYCTVPSHAARHAINTLWAWVRYYGALSGDSDLRVSNEFGELDPHQKTILSDDFGMGMSMHVLAGALNLTAFCDGKYFIDRLSPRLSRSVTITAAGAKNGSRKSPDFVGLDSHGRWHVIECKGTQSGPTYCNQQLRQGFSQKRAIEFQGTLKGESLVAGFDIAGENSATESRLVLVDPDAEKPPLSIEENDAEVVLETVARGKLARGLLLAGAPNLSRAMAAPFGDDPRFLADDKIAPLREERAARLRNAGLEERSRLTKSSDGYLGREATFELPFQLETPNGRFRRAVVRSEIIPDAIHQIEEEVRSDLSRGSDRLSADQERLAVGLVKVETDGLNGTLTDGKLFRSWIEFKEQRGIET